MSPQEIDAIEQELLDIHITLHCLCDSALTFIAEHDSVVCSTASFMIEMVQKEILSKVDDMLECSQRFYLNMKQN